MQPLVTVYITNYNYAAFIEQSIESVLAQSLQDFELLIIDDGSTDNSQAIIERYRETPNVAIIYQQNKGLNITNNIAMRAAHGKYIMRLDADDYLDPHALRVMSEILESDDKLGLVFPDYYYIDKEGKITGEERRHNFEKEVSLFDQPAHGACTMIRLEFLRQIGGYNESFTCQDGYDLWIKFIMHFKVTNVNRSLFYYRRHGNNLTTNEDRILKTRKQIKEIFVQQNFRTPRTLAVIPVRNTFYNKINWPLHELSGITVLERKIMSCLTSKNISSLVVSTADNEILEHLERLKMKYSELTVVKRPASFAGSAETLYKTLEQALESVSGNGWSIEAIMTVSLEYPFADSDVIDDAINTLTLFKTDSVLSVRPDDKTYFQHTGHSLRPILDHDRFTRIEREALYKGAGGVAVSTIENFRKNKRVASGSIGHVVVDIKAAFAVNSSFELNMYESFLTKGESVVS